MCEGNWSGEISFSARHLILARLVGLREAERPPVELWVTIVVAEESS